MNLTPPGALAKWGRRLPNTGTQQKARSQQGRRQAAGRPEAPFPQGARGGCPEQAWGSWASGGFRRQQPLHGPGPGPGLGARGCAGCRSSPARFSRVEVSGRTRPRPPGRSHRSAMELARRAPSRRGRWAVRVWGAGEERGARPWWPPGAQSPLLVPTAASHLRPPRPRDRHSPARHAQPGGQEHGRRHLPLALGTPSLRSVPGPTGRRGGAPGSGRRRRLVPPAPSTSPRSSEEWRDLPPRGAFAAHSIGFVCSQRDRPFPIGSPNWFLPPLEGKGDREVGLPRRSVAAGGWRAPGAGPRLGVGLRGCAGRGGLRLALPTPPEGCVPAISTLSVSRRTH